MICEWEFKHYKSIQAELLLHYGEKWALILGEQLLGVFDSPAEAENSEVRRAANGPKLLVHILSDADAFERVELPAFVIDVGSSGDTE